ncbi:hypothetical protein [Pseudomonas rhodesiae]|uniref:hypothetical protein n=1 Tax=Pseudomonas rhodesiae TaxID=76760 RepID=UPI0032B17112
MAVKLKKLGLVLFCTVAVSEAVQAQNCRLSVSQPTVDYGVIRSEPLAHSPTLALGTRMLHLSVLCIEPSTVALRFAGSADGQGFRFGRQGHFRLTLKQAQMDGHAVEWAPVQLASEPVGGQLLPGQVLFTRAAGKRLTAQVQIDTELPSDALQVRNQAVLEGRGRFELVSPTVPLSR